MSLPKLAIALRNAPPGKAITRISLEGSGNQIVNDIGAGTTEAWRVVYQDTAPQAGIEVLLSHVMTPEERV